MGATISGGYTEGRASERELADLLRQQKKVQNFVQQRKVNDSTTGNGVSKTVFTSDALDSNTGSILQVKIQGFNTSGSVYGVFEKIGAFYRTTGAAAQKGATVDKHTPIRSNAAIDAALVANSDGSLSVTVNDGSQAAMTWTVWIEMRSSQAT